MPENEPKFKQLPYGDLFFDRRNPRLPPRLRDTDDDSIIDWMLKDASLLELSARTIACTV